MPCPILSNLHKCIFFHQPWRLYTKAFVREKIKIMYLLKNDLKEKTLRILKALSLTVVLSFPSTIVANASFLPFLEEENVDWSYNDESIRNHTMVSPFYEVIEEEKAAESRHEESVSERETYLSPVQVIGVGKYIEPLMVEQQHFLAYLTGLTNVNVDIQRSVGLIEVTVTNNSTDLVETIIIQDSIILREEVQSGSTSTFKITTTVSEMEYTVRVLDPISGDATIFFVESL